MIPCSFFAKQRSSSDTGITIPSQVRYAHYFANIISGRTTFHEPRLSLENFYLWTDTCSNYSQFFPCTIELGSDSHSIYHTLKNEDIKMKSFKDNKREYVHATVQTEVQGDVLIRFSTGSGEIFQFFFHTAFIENDLLMLGSNDLDFLKGKKSSEVFRIELKFKTITSEENSAIKSNTKLDIILPRLQEIYFHHSFDQNEFLPSSILDFEQAQMNQPQQKEIQQESIEDLQ